MMIMLKKQVKGLVMGVGTNDKSKEWYQSVNKMHEWIKNNGNNHQSYQHQLIFNI